MGVQKQFDHCKHINSQIKIGKVKPQLDKYGLSVIKYTIEIYHKGLNEYKFITAPDMDMVTHKAELQAVKWTNKWERVERKLRMSEVKKASEEEAKLKTAEAVKMINNIENIIQNMKLNNKVDWNLLKKTILLLSLTLKNISNNYMRKRKTILFQKKCQKSQSEECSKSIHRCQQSQ